MKILEGKSITSVQGIKAAGITAGIKKSGRKDVCVVYSEKEAVGAAVFTTNKVKAAPLFLDMENIKNDTIRAIVVNSGNANACTGKEGYENAVKMGKVVAEHFAIDPKEVIVESTGVIGVQLPMDKIVSGIEEACKSVSADGGHDAAEAIMTTDLFVKEVAIEIEVDGKPVTIAGMAKGSGMIHPNMATMLGTVVTDINITKDMLEKAFKGSVDDSYNMISVDGDTSTNDMVVVMANGMAENKIIDSEDENFAKFKAALDYLNKELAKLIAIDGEGATKLLEVNVVNAKDIKSAKSAAKSVITSNLTKCAFFGEDANWGRILCAVGYSEADFDPEKIDIFLKSNGLSIQVAENGRGMAFDELLASEILKEKEVTVYIDMKIGEAEATAWGCDLSYKYVEINGAYRT
ncbi:bifunctional glutamate N-acetyltransferase/amino-acid acetyltransferase ArgJ [uncultured Ilyobacter sp.]|uniref:bifunctional glutamate N-acetyltransferase/amino-acid acetyltransferase ArgJ n=1 Tax=uncultured Ilyobacter sp. TaxID=544433 RepID=UPI0029C05C6D|nr:bifunctional glutamate N-acetyltransferase/amino-acid acetyltransferase ArgJ [uncultured Ilyobacter sp.]